MLFLTPLIQTLGRRLGGCEIDLLVGDTHYSPLFKELPGIAQVFDFRRELLVHPLRLLRWLRRFRSRHYDLVIAPSPASEGDRIALCCAHTRYRLSFMVSDQWVALTHAVPLPVNKDVHEALTALTLLHVMFPRDTFKARLDIGLRREERAIGRLTLANVLTRRGRGFPSAPVVGFFIEARCAKRLPTLWWQRWRQQMRSHSVRLVQILPPTGTMPLVEGEAYYRSANLRRLGAVLSQMDMFVSADTGVMHLASAVNVPTVGLFKASAIHLYRPYGPSDLALDVRMMAPEDVADAVYAHHIRCAGGRELCNGSHPQALICVVT